MSVEYANVEALSTHEHIVLAESLANVRLILDSKAASSFFSDEREREEKARNQEQYRQLAQREDFSLCFALIP